MTRIKFKYLFPLMLLLVCCFVFVGCDNQTKSNPVDDPYQGHIVYELSLDNQWKYFDVVSTRTSVDTFQTFSGIRQCNYDSVYYEIAGLLDFVIYDNVVLTFEYKILDQYDETIEYIATYQLELLLMVVVGFLYLIQIYQKKYKMIFLMIVWAFVKGILN